MLTDERQGEGLWDALRQLPRGSGVIVRHYELSLQKREALFLSVRRIAKTRRLTVAWSGRERDAVRLGADAVYGADCRSSRLPRLWPVHHRIEIVAAERAKADLLLLSPVFPTRSHPGSAGLGVVRFGLLTRGISTPVIALGGMTQLRTKRLAGLDVQGWAAIDAWIRT
jgi:thiamine-phosphate pyrophosphorylase